MPVLARLEFLPFPLHQPHLALYLLVQAQHLPGHSCPPYPEDANHPLGQVATCG